MLSATAPQKEYLHFQNYGANKYNQIYFLVISLPRSGYKPI